MKNGTKSEYFEQEEALQAGGLDEGTEEERERRPSLLLSNLSSSTLDTAPLYSLAVLVAQSTFHPPPHTHLNVTKAEGQRTWDVSCCSSRMFLVRKLRRAS